MFVVLAMEARDTEAKATAAVLTDEFGRAGDEDGDRGNGEASEKVRWMRWCGLETRRGEERRGGARRAPGGVVGVILLEGGGERSNFVPPPSPQSPPPTHMCEARFLTCKMLPV